MSGFKEIDYDNIDYIYIDTCVLLQYYKYNRSSELTNKCTDLFIDSYNADVPLVISEQVLHEIKKVIIADSFASRGYNNEHDIKDLQEKSYSTYVNMMNEALNSYKTYRYKIEHNEMILNDVLVPSSEAYRISDDIMFQYNIHGADDALHLGIALDYGIPAFASVDKDFAGLSIPNLEIYFERNNNK